MAGAPLTCRMAVAAAYWRRRADRLHELAEELRLLEGTAGYSDRRLRTWLRSAHATLREAELRAVALAADPRLAVTP